MPTVSKLSNPNVIRVVNNKHYNTTLRNYYSPSTSRVLADLTDTTTSRFMIRHKIRCMKRNQWDVDHTINILRDLDYMSTFENGKYVRSLFINNPTAQSAIIQYIKATPDWNVIN
jgi:hypothetical protein